MTRRTIGLSAIQLEAWPARDAAGWRAALVPGSFLDAGGALAERTEVELKRFRYCYGVWLAFLRQERSVIVSGLDHLESAEIRGLLQLLQSRLAPYSVLSFLTGLLKASRAMAPARGFPMLERAIRHTKRTATPSRDKGSRLRSPAEVRALGFSLMSLPQRGTTRVRLSNRYLDGLAIAMLISMPLRISNFGGLQLGRGIQRIGECYWISVGREDTKNGRPIEFALPPDLTDPIEHYLAEHRPYLLAQGKRSSDLPQTTFWVSSWGTPLSSQLLAKRISQRTEEAFGVSMSPHLFRDAAATTIAIEDPEHVGMILPILGHSSPRISEKFYNQARTFQSARKYLSILEALRTSKGV